jgi:hypothetical protein
MIRMDGCTIYRCFDARSVQQGIFQFISLHNSPNLPLLVGACPEHVLCSGSEVHRTYELISERLSDGGCCLSNARTLAEMIVRVSVYHARHRLWTAWSRIDWFQAVGCMNIRFHRPETFMLQAN